MKYKWEKELLLYLERPFELGIIKSGNEENRVEEKEVIQPIKKWIEEIKGVSNNIDNWFGIEMDKSIRIKGKYVIASGKPIDLVKKEGKWVLYIKRYKQISREVFWKKFLEIWLCRIVLSENENISVEMIELVVTWIIIHYFFLENKIEYAYSLEKEVKEHKNYVENIWNEIGNPMSNHIIYLDDILAVIEQFNDKKDDRERYEDLYTNQRKYFNGHRRETYFPDLVNFLNLPIEK